MQADFTLTWNLLFGSSFTFLVPIFKNEQSTQLESCNLVTEPFSKTENKEWYALAEKSVFGEKITIISDTSTESSVELDQTASISELLEQIPKLSTIKSLRTGITNLLQRIQETNVDDENNKCNLQEYSQLWLILCLLVRELQLINRNPDWSFFQPFLSTAMQVTPLIYLLQTIQYAWFTDVLSSNGEKEISVLAVLFQAVERGAATTKSVRDVILSLLTNKLVVILLNLERIIYLYNIHNSLTEYLFEQISATVLDNPNYDAIREFLNFPSVLEVEYFNWKITQDLLQKLKLAFPAERDLYEAKNILERWLLSLANAREETIEQSCKTTPDGTVYLNLPENDPLQKKMLAEFKQKFPKMQHFNPVVLIQYVKDQMQFIPAQYDPEVPTYQDCLKYEQFVISPLTDRMQKMLQRAGYKATLRSAIRYQAALQGSQHWGLPQSHHASLYLFGFRNEGFTSPFNSRYAFYPEGRFCSLFPEVDHPFGNCIGNFFKVTLTDYPGGWYINPPFVEHLLLKAVKHILLHLSVAGKYPLLVNLLLPAWLDAEFYLLIKSSPYVVHETKLLRNKYYFELPDGSKIQAKVDTLYLTISSHPIPQPQSQQLKQLAMEVMEQP
jgi:hypothetical protein